MPYISARVSAENHERIRRMMLDTAAKAARPVTMREVYSAVTEVAKYNMEHVQAVINSGQFADEITE